MTDKAILNSLASKLESLDLTDEEQGTLNALISRAASAEAAVQGFGWDGGTVGLSPMALKLGAGIGRFPPVPAMEMGKPEFRRNNPTER